MAIVPMSRKPNVKVSSLIVPSVTVRDLLASEREGHGDRRDDRQVSAEEHHQARADVEGDRLRRRVRVVVQPTFLPRYSGVLPTI